MQFKLVNLNVWLGGKLFDNLLKFLTAEQPDILTIQESYNGTGELPREHRTVEILKSELALPYSSFSACFQEEFKEGKLDRGNAVLSKFPIVSANHVFYDTPYGLYSESKPEDFPFFPRTLQHAVIEAGRKDLNVFNTQGIWEEEGEDSDRRLKMSQTISDRIKERENVILAGDFNVQPNTKSIGNIEKHLVNVFKNELTTSFNMKRKTNPGYATAVVDMVFVSRDIKVLSHSAPSVDISDHLPLVCEFELG